MEAVKDLHLRPAGRLHRDPGATAALHARRSSCRRISATSAAPMPRGLRGWADLSAADRRSRPHRHLHRHRLQPAALAGLCGKARLPPRRRLHHRRPRRSANPPLQARRDAAKHLPGARILLLRHDDRGHPGARRRRRPAVAFLVNPRACEGPAGHALADDLLAAPAAAPRVRLGFTRDVLGRPARLLRAAASCPSRPRSPPCRAPARPRPALGPRLLPGRAEPRPDQPRRPRRAPTSRKPSSRCPRG